MSETSLSFDTLTGPFTLAPLTPNKIGDFAIQGVGSFDPQDDMTPIESARISLLFLYVATACWPIDSAEYVTRHNLQRHFRKDTL